MAKLKVIGFVTSSEDTFNAATQFSHKDGVQEYYIVMSLSQLEQIEGLTSVVFVADSYLLEEIDDIKTAAMSKGVSVKWQ